MIQGPESSVWVVAKSQREAVNKALQVLDTSEEDLVINQGKIEAIIVINQGKIEAIKRLPGFFFSSLELKTQVSYSGHLLSVYPSVCL